MKHILEFALNQIMAMYLICFCGVIDRKNKTKTKNLMKHLISFKIYVLLPWIHIRSWKARRVEKNNITIISQWYLGAGPTAVILKIQRLFAKPPGGYGKLQSYVKKSQSLQHTSLFLTLSGRKIVWFALMLNTNRDVFQSHWNMLPYPSMSPHFGLWQQSSMVQ